MHIYTPRASVARSILTADRKDVRRAIILEYTGAGLTLNTHPHQQHLGSFPHEANWRGKKPSGTCGSAPGPYIPRLALTLMQCWSVAGHVFARGRLGLHAGFPYDPCRYWQGGLCERPRSLTIHRFARRSRSTLAQTFDPFSCLSQLTSLGLRVSPSVPSKPWKRK